LGHWAFVLAGLVMASNDSLAAFVLDSWNGVFVFSRGCSRWWGTLTIVGKLLFRRWNFSFCWGAGILFGLCVGRAFFEGRSSSGCLLGPVIFGAVGKLRRVPIV